jgi:hypothetical protein
MLVLFGAAVHRLEARRIPDWHIELDRYIAARWHSEDDVRVRSAVAAREPWNMTPEMSHPVTSDWMWESVRLPYPPGQVMCVLLERDAEVPVQEVEYEIVYVCHHSDALWKHGWVVHEAGDDPLSEVIRRDLSALDCRLPVNHLVPGSIVEGGTIPCKRGTIPLPLDLDSSG